MAFSFADSIVALSSGRLPSGVAIVRISGSQTRFALETMTGAVPTARVATYTAMRSSEGLLIDSGLVLFFPGPASFTGEDCGEVHIHGGKAVVAAVLSELAKVPGVRLAEAGEFTRRAFLNGKIDLLQAEALADVVSAETEAQRRLAVYNSEGAQAALYATWRNRLIRARAMIEAELDFADEQDVPGSAADETWQEVRSLVVEIDRHAGGYHKAEMIRDGYDVVIVGAPNAGKSSLLNALAHRDVAIVSEEPGTTRDLVEVLLDVNGMKVRLTDTAGIRDEAGKVEAIGIERALQRAANADLVLRLIDMTDRAVNQLDVAGARTVSVGTKVDTVGGRLNVPEQVFDFVLSSVTGEGMDELIGFIGQRATESAGPSGEILPSRLRHVLLLNETASFLREALERPDAGLELRAESLRHAADRLGRISGAVDVEDLLDVIFAQFCIGK